MSYSVDKLIKEWLAERGSDDLPGKGKPLDLDEYFRWPEELRLGFSILKNAGYVPEEVERLREIRRLKEEMEGCSEAQARTRLQCRLNEEEVRLSLSLEQSRHQRRR